VLKCVVCLIVWLAGISIRCFWGVVGRLHITGVSLVAAKTAQGLGCFLFGTNVL